MNPTTKILLGAGAVGGATFLLWRLWPQEAVYIPPPPAPYVPEPEPIFNVPTASYVPPSRMRPTVTPMATCPPGTFPQDGVCIPYQID